jgi:hypothetical protein
MPIEKTIRVIILKVIGPVLLVLEKGKTINAATIAESIEKAVMRNPIASLKLSGPGSKYAETPSPPCSLDCSIYMGSHMDKKTKKNSKDYQHSLRENFDYLFNHVQKSIHQVINFKYFSTNLDKGNLRQAEIGCYFNAVG